MLTSHPLPNRRRLQSVPGFTLMEMMITLAVGMIILAGIIYVSITLSRSLAAITNYVQLDADSRNTLDLMSRDIRNASSTSSAILTASSITMSGTNVQGVGYTFTYNWDGSNVWRTYAASGNTNTWLVLSNCAYLAFSNYSRVPESNFTFSACSPAATKLISVSWKCTRSILGQKLNTESVQTAKIVVRN